MLETIETMIKPVLTAVEKGKKPCFKIVQPRTSKLANVMMGSRRFTLLMVVLDAMHELLSNGTNRTMRDLFYQHTALFKDQGSVRQTLLWIASTLGMARDRLPIVSTAKGLYYFEGECRSVGVACELGNEQFMLIVEKEAIFHTIKEDYEAVKDAVGPFLLVTGKGYPCLGTRRFVRSIPLRKLIIVDHDPYGMEIAWIYCHGSGLIHAEDEELRTDVELLGLTAQQIDQFAAGEQRSTDQLNTRGKARLKGLLKQTKSGWPAMHEQLRLMESTGVTAEIEALTDNSHRFTREILPLLIRSQLYSK